MTTVRAAGFLIFRNDTVIEYLLLKASYGKKHWSPPKGHVDPGEDDFTTAVRETREEAGYSDTELIIFKDKPYTLKYAAHGKPKSVVYWLAQLVNFNNDPKLSDEHTDFRWLNKDETKLLEGNADFGEMVDYFHNEISNLKDIN